MEIDFKAVGEDTSAIRATIDHCIVSWIKSHDPLEIDDAMRKLLDDWTTEAQGVAGKPGAKITAEDLPELAIVIRNTAAALYVLEYLTRRGLELELTEALDKEN